jgi:hypothetical protein
LNAGRDSGKHDVRNTLFVNEMQFLSDESLGRAAREDASNPFMA